MSQSSLKKIIKVISVMILSVMLLNILPVSADTYQSYQAHNGQGESTMVAQQAVYIPEFSSNGFSLGLQNFVSLKDCCVIGDEMYLLDSGASTIYVIGPDYSLIRTINNFTYNDEPIEIIDAEGIYVSENNEIYIADPENQCVFVVDQTGSVITKIEKPNSPIVPEELEFKAKKVLVDDDGYIFVLCEGVYYGAMVFDSNYEFCGFFGANQTPVDLISTIKNFFLNILKTDTQRQYSVRALPYEFDDIYEHNGFIYTATSSSSDNKGQLRKLSYSGINILEHEGQSADGYAFGNGETVTLIDKSQVVDEFVAIAVDQNGFIYGLDATYGRVFVYDENCNLITAFGGGMGIGNQLGTFVKAAEMAIFGEDVLVLDSEKNTITVFKLSDFGKLLFETLSIYEDGDYEAAFPYWEKVLSQDAYNQLAYSGMANYYIFKGDNKTALSLARKGYDRDLYERAFEQVRLEFLTENFVWIFLIFVLVIAFAIWFNIYRKKHKKEENGEIGIFKTVICAPFKPIQTSLYMKKIAKNDKKRINIYTVIAFGIFALFFVFKVLETTAGGFMYVSYDPNKYNSALIFISTFGLLALWCVVNWGLCTLFEGKGTFKEIVTVTSFAFIPQIIYSIFFIIASQVLVYSEEPIITGVYVVCWLITIIVLLVGLSIIHEYSFFRSIGMSLVTIIGMVAVSFLLLLVLTLFKDVIEFVGSIYNEIAYRGN